MCSPFKIKLFTSFILFFPWAAPATSNDDQYLLELEAEASDEINTESKPVVTEAESLKSDQDKSRLNQKLRQTEFNTRLSKELPATTRAYNKLSDEYKKKVVDAYFNSGKSMTVASRLLFNLYFKYKISK